MRCQLKERNWSYPMNCVRRAVTGHSLDEIRGTKVTATGGVLWGTLKGAVTAGDEVDRQGVTSYERTRKGPSQHRHHHTELCS